MATLTFLAPVQVETNGAIHEVNSVQEAMTFLNTGRQVAGGRCSVAPREAAMRRLPARCLSNRHDRPLSVSLELPAF